MIDAMQTSLLYWDLRNISKVNMDNLTESVKRLVKSMYFKQVIIMADNSVIPAKIIQVAKTNLGADLFIPKTIKLRNIANNKLHPGVEVTREILLENIWTDEQLITIGHMVPGAINISNDEQAQISYDTFINEPETVVKIE